MTTISSTLRATENTWVMPEAAKNEVNFLANLCYERRNKVDPYWIEGVVAGYKDGERYLGYADLYGTYLENDFICTGYARYLCGHIIKTKWHKDCSLEEALSILTECFSALFARCCPATESL